MAREGLRTLMMAQKELTRDQFNDMMQKLQEIKTSNSSDRDQRLNQFYDQCEKSLNFLGCTAIEDKLQNGVPETIELLIKANIRVWVLTGDKQETAIEIGKSCNLIV